MHLALFPIVVMATLLTFAMAAPASNNLKIKLPTAQRLSVGRVEGTGVKGSVLIFNLDYYFNRQKLAKAE